MQNRLRSAGHTCKGVPYHNWPALARPHSIQTCTRHGSFLYPEPLHTCNAFRLKWFPFADPQVPNRVLPFSKKTPILVRQSIAMASQRTPVIVRRFSRDWIAGYAPSSFAPDAPELEILDQAAKLCRLASPSVKCLCSPPVLTVSGTYLASSERLHHTPFTFEPPHTRP